MTDDEFKKLIDKYLEGNASNAEKRLIDSFFNAQLSGQNPDHDVSDEMWYSVQGALATEGGKGKNGIRGLVFYPKAVLISLVLLILVATGIWGGYHYGFLDNNAGKWISSATKFGEKLVMTLPDGSVVHLNSGSSISYPEKFDSRHRDIILTGEAFFEVSRDESKPFLIRSGDVLTKVLGTSFNIKAFPDENVTVTVATGKVEVGAADKSRVGRWDGPRVVLIPHHQAVYDPELKSISTSPVDINPYVSWKNNTLQFDNTSLADAATVLSRWYGVRIEFDSEALGKCRVNGQFKDQNFINVLESIEYMYNIQYEIIEENHVMIYGKGCQ